MQQLRAQIGVKWRRSCPCALPCRICARKHSQALPAKLGMCAHHVTDGLLHFEVRTRSERCHATHGVDRHEKPIARACDRRRISHHEFSPETFAISMRTAASIASLGRSSPWALCMQLEIWGHAAGKQGLFEPGRPPKVAQRSKQLRHLRPP